MDLYDKIKEIKKAYKLNNKDLGSLIGKSGDTFRKGMNRKSLNDYEIKSLAKAIASMKMHDNEEQRLLVEDLLSEIRRKINKNRTDVLSKILTESEEKDLRVSIQDDPEYKDLFDTEKSKLIHNKNGNSYREIRDGVYNIEAEVIPFEAYASYAESLETGTVEEDFDTEIFRVDRIGRGNYKAFIVKGDSMNGGGIDDTKDGATVLARELGRQHWKDGFNDTEYGWIILCKENIFHKDIVDYDSETGDITLHSRNKSPEYSDFTINLNDCYQIFKVIKRTF